MPRDARGADATGGDAELGDAVRRSRARRPRVRARRRDGHRRRFRTTAACRTGKGGAASRRRTRLRVVGASASPARPVYLRRRGRRTRRRPRGRRGFREARDRRATSAARWSSRPCSVHRRRHPRAAEPAARLRRHARRRAGWRSRSPSAASCGPCCARITSRWRSTSGCFC